MTSYVQKIALKKKEREGRKAELVSVRFCVLSFPLVPEAFSARSRVNQRCTRVTRVSPKAQPITLHHFDDEYSKRKQVRLQDNSVSIEESNQ